MFEVPNVVLALLSGVVIVCFIAKKSPTVIIAESGVVISDE